LNSEVEELLDGVRRVTFPLPLGIDHVHCYLLRGDDGWTVVDTGLGVSDARERWTSVLGALDAPVARVVITHFHPDHVGAAADVAELTGAPVLQGREDYGQCVRVWGESRDPRRLADYMLRHGLPRDQVPRILDESDALASLVRFARDPEPLDPGRRVDGWEVLSLPGHADGHIGLLRDGLLVAGDALLAGISPNVGLYPESRPDPLADYLASLEQVIELAPRVAYAGHRESIEDPPGRARALIEHHRERLEATLRTIAEAPRNAYEVSLLLFPDPLHPTLRRFALAEARAHLERLVHAGRAGRVDAEDSLRYSGA
jgi:glyoxylase-like metal-dependent hydrolase (beta-lactamase superfamily II)